MWTWSRRLLIASMISTAALGCAEERAPISRVQANALAKSFFVGNDLDDPADDPEFYSRATVVDVGYGDSNGFYTSGNAQSVARIKWEITEDLLLARLTYEAIEDADGHGSRTTNNGTVVAAYAIKSHFDIRRGYNAATGEENNVIEENTSDRPWYERDYFRVDWSANLVTDAYDFDWLSLQGLFGGISYQSLHTYVSDPASEDAPVFDTEAGYFDITNRVWASPKILETPYGTYPACFFNGEITGGSYPVGSCNPTEIKIRLSYRRVTDNDYQAKDWTGTRFSMYGAFYEERRGFEDQYGVVDSRWHRFGSFYNIWQKSHVDLACNTAGTTPAGASPTRDGDALSGRPENGTDDECEDQGAPAGSHCDPLARKCTIPYASREVRPIPWHFGPDQDAEGLFDWTAKATGEWDLAVRVAVQTGRLTECRRTNGASIGAGDQAACDAAFPADEASVKAAVPEIIFLCHNPVATGDRPECGAVGQKARLGDLRYNFVNAIATPQSGSPWGVMLDGVDPLTGEKVQSSINIWDPVTTSAAQGAIDVIRWMNGEIDEEDIKSGAYINRFAITGDLQPKSFQDFQTMSRDSADQRLRGLSPPPAQAVYAPRALPPLSPKELVEAGNAAFQAAYGTPVDGGPKVAARIAAARGTQVEAELTTPNFVEIAGLDPSIPLDDAAMEYASPLRGNDLGHEMDLAALRERSLAERGACRLEAPEPTAFVGMAKVMREKFPIGDSETEQETFDRVTRMREYLRKRMHYGIILHEMGHSIGLRHNFVGSYDAFNFRPQYWQLRTHNGEITKKCDDRVDDGSTCVGPRWYDPMTQDEDEGLLWMWQHTTVMDYPGDISQDTLGLGPYDKAAARFFYTDTLDVWDTPGQDCAARDDGGTCTEPNAFAIQGKVGNFGGIGGPWTFKGDYQFVNAVHYSQFNKEFELLRNCRPSTVTQPGDWDEARDGVWSPVFDGHVVLGTECDGPPVDYVDYRDLDSYTVEKTKARVRWPHMFATDYSADIGNVAVLRHDNGADMYEQFNYLINVYENRHVFDNFRRGRQSFSVRGAAMRSMSRFSDKMRNIVQAFALYHDFVLRGLSLESGLDYVTPYEATDGVLKPNALAASLAFDHFARQLTRPQPGGYTVRKNWAGDRVAVPQESLFTNSSTMVVLPEGSQIYSNGEPGFGARKVNNSLNNADGSFDIQWLTSAGSYYDKVYATYHLTESSNRFLDVSLLDFVDGRYRNLSFVNLYPDGFRRLVGTALTGDTALLGARLSSASGNTPQVDPNDRPKRPMGWVSWWPEAGPQVCWPSRGFMTCVDSPSEDPIDQDAPAKSIAVDASVGIEVQKFLVYYSLLYLPENWKSDWVDEFRIYSVGSDSVPDLPTENAIYFKDPESGTLYIARRHGTEDLFGKTVEKRISARMLAWANVLAQNAYEVDSIDPVTGAVNVAIQDGAPVLAGGATKCEDSQACVALRNYKALIDFTRQTASTFGFPAPEPKGINFH
jgi:hypothetical protein